MNQEDLKQHTKWLFSTIIERYKGEIVGGDIMNTHTIMEDLYDIDTVPSIDIQNMNGHDYLSKLPDNSVDLVLTDPPYIISKDTGMDKFLQCVEENKEKGIEYVKTDEEWDTYKKEHNIQTDENKEKYKKFGSIYGKKYATTSNFGNWDKEFTIDNLKLFIKSYYDKLKKGGTIIIFFDIWKIGELKQILEECKFKQIRFIEWVKTNPVPLNSRLNYLTNSREIALTAVKGGKPTFHSQYDNGIYRYPIQSGKDRFHPTQKSILLFEELIQKHSNEGDTVVDTFLGGGTTAIACKHTNRVFKGCEISKEYYEKCMKVV